MASEIRQRLDALGLSMKGKRDLRFRIAKAGEADAEADVAKGRRKRKGGKRAHLTAVK